LKIRIVKKIVYHGKVAMENKKLSRATIAAGARWRIFRLHKNSKIPFKINSEKTILLPIKWQYSLKTSI
jgi:hypothetical protein